MSDVVHLGSFTCVMGDEEVDPTSAPGFAAAWDEVAAEADFGLMGVAFYRRMTRSIDEYLIEALRRTLEATATAPHDVDHVVFATTDVCLGQTDAVRVGDVLSSVGMVGATPVLLSFQQCCSSLSALRYAHDLFSDPTVRHVVLACFDRHPDDDRVRPFAIMSDAVTSCLLRRGDGDLALLSVAVGVDHDGLAGRDSFASRQKVASETMTRALDQGATDQAEVVKMFPTNLFLPLALFNASMVGIDRKTLHCIDTLRTCAHSGGCDWMINLIDYRDTVGLRAGERYLAQSSAPGFYACALLEGT